MKKRLIFPKPGARTPWDRAGALRRVKARALEGAESRDWYGAAGAAVREVARDLDLPALYVGAMFAVTSPRADPAANRRRALFALQASPEAIKAGGWGAMYSVRVGAYRVRAAYEAGTDPVGAIKGPKAAAFARNIAGDLSVATVDVWACRTLGIAHKRVKGARAYWAAADVFAEVAEDLGWQPAQVQAAAWVAERRRYGKAHHGGDAANF